jgi:hypothetical protein
MLVESPVQLQISSIVWGEKESFCVPEFVIEDLSLNLGKQLLKAMGGNNGAKY